MSPLLRRPPLSPHARTAAKCCAHLLLYCTSPPPTLPRHAMSAVRRRRKPHAPDCLRCTTHQDEGKKDTAAAARDLPHAIANTTRTRLHGTRQWVRG
ncbi:hypothetical protein CC85DRAFT_286544 [Cutaneotrichosporon oleaginosum]|uniref:Uncharacterized protein n=1 Tax=Cutaneotrichosporon oleaginosum TaxID=879819 RepID=A0A0J0XJU9_9TREE|nr:uncharacterized protein CC85DRAFT_286544 [Cutaneotrichosporon oleaginosum]KLT41372.1 hypothetical protein CC85DRAFT_286544 [Cutaneotrichosporon oleaginosum]TXT06314.1 hypothetical protein COLE_05645 [Cutaneotrichosporon oleaginosum]